MKLKDLDQNTADVRKIKSTLRFWREMMERHALADKSGTFQGAHNLFGPLSTSAKRKILSYFNSPSEELWEAAYLNQITVESNLLDAWKHVDENAVQRHDRGTPWERIPDPELLRSAIRLTIDRDLQKAQSRITRLEKMLEDLQEELETTSKDSELDDDAPSLNLV